MVRRTRRAELESGTTRILGYREPWPDALLDGVFETSFELAEQEARAHRTSNHPAHRTDAAARTPYWDPMTHNEPVIRNSVFWTDGTKITTPPAPPAGMVPFCQVCATKQYAGGEVVAMDTWCWGCSRSIRGGIWVPTSALGKVPHGR